MSLQPLFDRMVFLNSALKQQNELIQQLAKLQPPPSWGADDAAGETPPLDNEQLRADLSLEIQGTLRQWEQELEILQQDVQDVQDSLPARSGRRSTLTGTDTEQEREAARLQAGCAKLEEDLKLTRARFRRAQLQARAKADRAVQRERAAYLASLQAAAAAMTSPSPSSAEAVAEATDSQAGETKAKNAQHQTLTHAQQTAALFANRRNPRARETSSQTMSDDILLSASSDVTSSLKRTHALLTTELSRSRFAAETLETSNAALAELNERYVSFSDLLSKSSGLLTTLLKSQKSDTWYLETTCWILLSTIAWLLFRRLLYGPLWWLAWFPLRNLWVLLSYALSPLLALVGAGGAGARPGTTLALRSDGPVGSMSPAYGTVGPSVASVGSNGAELASVAVESTPSVGLAGRLSQQVASAVEAATAAAGTAVPVASPPPEGGSEEQGSREEQTQQEKQRQGDSQDEGKQAEDQQPRRGDGQPLRQRDERVEPRNPKKRMMEEPPPEEEQKTRDEL